MIHWSAQDFAATILCLLLIGILARHWIVDEWKKLKQRNKRIK